MIKKNENFEMWTQNIHLTFTILIKDSKVNPC